MKQEINIYVCANPTKENPESHRLKVLYKDKRDARRVKQTFPRFENKKAAVKAKTQWTLDYANDAGFFAPPVVSTEPEPEEDKPLTFRDYAPVYWAKHEKNLRSKTHESDIRTLVDYFGDKPLSEIDYAALYEFEQKMRHTPYIKEIKVKAAEPTINPLTKRKRYEVTKVPTEFVRSDSTVNKYVSRVRHLLYQAYREKRIAEKPEFYSLVKPENAKPTTAITFVECERLLAACTDERAHLYLQVLCVFETGCRLSEYKAIRKRDLDIDTGFCWVNISKQKKNAKQRPPRRCYFPKILIEAIKADGFEKKKPNDLLFDKRDPKRAWATAKKLAFQHEPDEARRDLLLDLDLQRSLRKSAAIHYSEAKIDSLVSDYQLSWAPKTTGDRHYRVVTPELQLDEFRKYEEFSIRERSKTKVAAKIAAA